MSLAGTHLVRRAACGDALARRELCARLDPAIRARVRYEMGRRRKRRSGSWQLEDFSQQVWFILLKDGCRQLLAYDHSRGKSLEAYVGMIARREFLNVLRGLRETDPIPSYTKFEGPDPETSVLAADRLRRCYRAISEQLAPRGRLVLKAFFLEARRVPEIATDLGATQGAINTWVHRIRRLIKNWLAAHF